MRMFKFFINLDKEEQWLNEQARKGWELTGKSWGYEFRQVEPKELNFRIDYRHFNNREEFENYRVLFEDSGWKHVAGTKSSGQQYFVRSGEAESAEIFSDEASKAARYQRMSRMWLSLAVVYLPIIIALATSGAVDASALLQPKELYYTPGLWSKTGTEFWTAFAWETPFALFRGIAWLALPILVVSAVVCSFKASRLYRKNFSQ
jgi:Protein of unknown function (DUF2812).